MIPDSLSIATLFPDAAMRPNRLAEPLSCADMEENVSVCKQGVKAEMRSARGHWPSDDTTQQEGVGDAYSRIYELLVPCIVVDVDGHAAQCRHFGRQVVQARVVLALALVGLGHGRDTESAGGVRRAVKSGNEIVGSGGVCTLGWDRLDLRVALLHWV